MYQIITPNPDIPCKPGWCLEYVNNAFGVPAVYGSATAAWDASTTKHYARDFPAGVWLPVWYGLANEPLGHVVLRAPDGSVYSTSDLTNVPHHHPSLDELESYYAYYGMPLTYRGWTEDVEGTPVVAPSSGTISVEGSITQTTTTEDDEMISAETQAWLSANLLTKADGAYQNSTHFTKSDGAWQNGILADISARLGKTLDKADGGYIVGLLNAIKPGATDASAIADAVVAAVGKDVASEVIKSMSEKLGAS